MALDPHKKLCQFQADKALVGKIEQVAQKNRSTFPQAIIWVLEEYFRVVKRSGLNLVEDVDEVDFDDSQVESGRASHKRHHSK